MEKEIWKDVVTDNGIYVGLYEVSNLGRVRSRDVDYYSEKAHRQITTKGKIRSLSLAGNYLKVNLNCRGIRKTHHVHKLVAEAFIGFREKGQEIDHIDNNKLNNRADNLRIITKKQNILRSVRGKVKLQGVWFRKANKNRPYCASIMIDGHRRELGAFATAEEAHERYKEELHKKHPKALQYLS